MNAALRIAQFDYDNRLPVEQDESPAVTAWIDRNALRLMDGQAVTWGYKKSDIGRVEPEAFIAAVQEHLVNRQIDGEDKQDAFARLVISNLVWGHLIEGRDQALYLMGPKSALKDIAAKLLEPHAVRAVELDAAWELEAEEIGF